MFNTENSIFISLLALPTLIAISPPMASGWQAGVVARQEIRKLKNNHNHIKITKPKTKSQICGITFHFWDGTDSLYGLVIASMAIVLANI